MSDAVKRVERYLRYEKKLVIDTHIPHDIPEYFYTLEDNPKLLRADVCTILKSIADKMAENERLSELEKDATHNAYELINVLEYAANNIAGDKRRGVFIKAYVEGVEWAMHQYNHGVSE